MTIFEARRNAKLTQEQVAGRAGIAPSTYARIERMNSGCNRANAAKIAAALGRDPSEVFPNFKDLRSW